MNIIKIYESKLAKFTKETPIYITENKIQSFNIIFPPTFGDYHTNELDCEMRVYLSDDEYMSYLVSTATGKGEVPITNDITEKVQTVKIVFFFTKDGNVIGKTNVVKKQIEDAPYLGDPLTPRAEADEKIREQAATIAEQSQTIETQGETITQQGEQITELNGEVTELSTENTRLEALTDTQRETIQNMLDNPPQPELYTPPIVTPTANTQQVLPPQGYDGLTEATVDRVTAEGVGFNKDYYKQGESCLGEVGTYNPFPEQSYSGVYYINPDTNGFPETIRVLNCNAEYLNLIFPTPIEELRTSVKNLEIRNCKFNNIPGFSTAVNIENVYIESTKHIPSASFQLCYNLRTVVFKDVETLDGSSNFYNCYALQNIDLGTKLKNLTYSCFGYCRFEEIHLPNSMLVLDSFCLYQNTYLKTINIPNSLTTISTSNPFAGDTALEFVTIENEFNCNNLNLSSSALYSVETIVSWLEALADRTGETAYTLTMGTTNLNKLTNEQKAIATNKNWNLA